MMRFSQVPADAVKATFLIPKTLAPYPGYAIFTSMGQKDRTDRYKTVGGGVGLVRVEVLVPKQDRHVVIETARQLREARQSLSDQASALHDEALSRFKTRCFWNANPPKSEDGLAAIHGRLQAYGDMEAWRLAARIRKVMRDAPR